MFKRCSRHSPPATRHSQKGLTLIEVLLAVVILGVGAGVLMLATARCLSVVKKAQHYTTAQRLIMRVGAENPLTRGEIQPGTDSGDFSDESAYRWEREIIEPEEDYRLGLYTVRTRVIWSDRGRDAFEETVTWLYIPQEDE